MKYLFYGLITVILSCSGCLKEPEHTPNPDDNQKITVLIFSNQTISHNPEENRYEVLIQEDKLTAEILSESEVIVALGNAESNTWTTVPGNFSPDLAMVAPVYFYLDLSIGRAIIYSEELPGFEEVDVQLVIKEDK